MSGLPTRKPRGVDPNLVGETPKDLREIVEDKGQRIVEALRNLDVVQTQVTQDDKGEEEQ